MVRKENESYVLYQEKHDSYIVFKEIGKKILNDS